MKKIVVSDVTLKAVSEQNISLTFREKLNIVELLNASGVDSFELPTIIDCKENEIIYRTVLAKATNAIVKIPVPESRENLQLAINCAKDCDNVVFQVVMPISTALMEYNYHLKASAMLDKIVEMIKDVKDAGKKVELVALDAFRAEEGFAIKCAIAAKNAGAEAITICDNEGVALPEDYEKLVKDIKDACDIKVAVRPSNALSMASACAVFAIKGGADGVDISTVGNYLLTSVFADIIYSKKFDFNVSCDLDFTNVKSIENTINGVVDFNNESDKQVQDVSVIFDNNSTIKDVAEISKQIGYELSDSEIGIVYEEVKKLLNNKTKIDIKEFEAVIASSAMQVPSTYHLVSYSVNASNVINATANVTLEKEGKKYSSVSTGDGPIEAAFNAIDQIIGHHYELDDFKVSAATKGRSAVGTSIIRLRADGKLYPGNGASTDIIGACIRAYVNAINKIVYEGK